MKTFFKDLHSYKDINPNYKIFYQGCIYEIAEQFVLDRLLTTYMMTDLKYKLNKHDTKMFITLKCASEQVLEQLQLLRGFNIDVISVYYNNDYSNNDFGIIIIINNIHLRVYIHPSKTNSELNDKFARLFDTTLTQLLNQNACNYLHSSNKLDIIGLNVIINKFMCNYTTFINLHNDTQINTLYAMDINFIKCVLANFDLFKEKIKQHNIKTIKLFKLDNYNNKIFDDFTLSGIDSIVLYDGTKNKLHIATIFKIVCVLNNLGLKFEKI